MRTPTRVSSLPPNPYEELASLAEPEAGPHPGRPAGAEADPEADPHIPGAGSTGHPFGFEFTYVTPDDDGSPPPGHRRAKRSRRRPRRSRRLPGVPRAAKLLIAAAACAAVLVLADRCAVLYAEKQAERKLQQQLHLAAAPQVDIHGFPFLTQVLAKELERVDVTVPHVAAGRVSLAKVRASGQYVRLTGDLPTDIKGAVIGKVDGNVLLSFADLNRELGASQVRFRSTGAHEIAAEGRVDVAGQQLRLRAQARLQRVGDRGLSTDIDGMSVDVPRVATYRPGKDKGLTLHRETAERISRDAARIKAMLSVPALAGRLGVSPAETELVLRDEDRLHRLTGAPRFVERLTQVNLVDAVVEHPWLLEKIGLDPRLITGVMQLRPPELTDRLSLSFQLPKEAVGLRLRDVSVERDGIRAEIGGVELPVGKTG
ncbi:DUF2993 domain-containing protein [Streptomyces sp. ISL-11]|uniref:LmeA family phospholipid-binding protein n=1 Tax=Streptomyces sp. ISL-11 TaxID=2819174 RepID=UPI001BE9E8D2|nr:DUF2993 domain-containing protein [Streptomyces sp. ISL-11]MBT2382446.1 DUF2993 domain-containing protein [Streptomyces sp. ISL-11]